MYAIKVRPQAQIDIADVVDQYENDSPGLGDRFLTRLRECMDRIQRFPMTYATARKQYRLAQLRVCPYAVIYREQPNEIIVHRLVHTSRDIGPILKGL